MGTDYMMEPAEVGLIKEAVMEQGQRVLERDGFRFTLEAGEVTIEGGGEKFGGSLREGESLEHFAFTWVHDWWRYLDDLAIRHEESRKVYHEYIEDLYGGEVW